MTATLRNYLNITGTNAFIAFILYLYLVLSKAEIAGLKILFLSLFVVFSVLSLIDAMNGDLKDKGIIRSIK